MSGPLLDLQAYRRSGQPDRLIELETETPLFVDWLTIRQDHGLSVGLPVVSDGWMVSLDRDGQRQFETLKRSDCEGSYDSRISLRCDGRVVEFHGNISRWGRADNVFGYSWPETLKRVNSFVNDHGLPPFTTGERLRFADTGWQWSGARVSRVDVTVNHSAMNWQDAQMLLSILARHHVGRQKGSLTPDGSTVLYGYGSQYASGKCYLKAHELEVHRKKKSGQHVGQDVIDWCRDVGLLREEATLKARFLTQRALAFIGDISQGRLEAVARERSQLRRLNDMTYPDLTTLSAGARAALARYEAGEPQVLKRTQFYKVRRQLLALGVDISIPSNVEKLKPPIRVIKLSALVAPEWYRRKYG